MRNLKLIYRSITNRPVYSLVSIIGLAIAFASVLIISINVLYLVNYDKLHEKGDRIYRLNGKLIMADSENYHAELGPAIGPAMLSEYPEIENMTRLTSWGKKLIAIPDKDISLLENVHFADESILDIFTLPLIHGIKEEALSQPSQLIICESLAHKLFGSTDILGKTLNMDKNDIYTISGVMKDMPENSHHKIQLLSRLPDRFMDFKDMTKKMGAESHWMPSCYTFILLKKKSSIESIHDKFPQFYDKYMVKFGDKINAKFKLITISLYNLHFSRHFDFDQAKGNYSYIYIFTIVAIFILIIAGINYINLFLSTLISRNKGFAIRKINGAKSASLIRVLMGESALIIGFSFLIGLFATITVKNLFGNYFTIPEEINYINVLIISILSISAFFLIILMAGFAVSSQTRRNPINLLKKDGLESSGKLNLGINKPLIVIQFSLSIILIISSILVSKQLNFMLTRDMGYDKDNIVMVKIGGAGVTPENINSLKNDLLKSTLISKVAFSTHIPGKELYSIHFPVNKDGNEVRIIAYSMGVDPGYFSLMNMAIIKGRGFFSKSSNNEKEIIINEAMMKKCGFTDDVVTTGIQNTKVIGIIKDVHFNSLHTGLKAVAYFKTSKESKGYMNIKLATTNIRDAVGFIKKTYLKFYPHIPYNQKFLDETIEDMYENDIRNSTYLNIFSLLSVFIACIGLLGISSIVCKSRTKEIGIRKVNGAKNYEILTMLNKDFIKWVAIAFIIAIPIAWYSMNKWLENFAYKTELSWWIFALAGGITLIIAISTVSWQSWRVANRNPVEALRYE